MKKMIKRGKDDGFTLIELMIVIAVIGILAIVLVPKVGTIKTQAKGAGIDTNVRMVQGYIQSKISSWNNQITTNKDVANDIVKAFTVTNEQDKIANPFDNSKKGVASGAINPSPTDLENTPLYVENNAGNVAEDVYGASNIEGTIVVAPAIDSNGYVTSVVVYAHDSTGVEMPDKRVVITP